MEKTRVMVIMNTIMHSVVLLCFLLAVLLTAPVFAGAPDVPSVVAAEARNPEIVWAKERLSVRAKEVRLKALLSAIGKKTGVTVSTSPGLEDKPVSVSFLYMDIERGMKEILNAAMVDKQGDPMPEGEEGE